MEDVLESQSNHSIFTFFLSTIKPKKIESLDISKKHIARFLGVEDWFITEVQSGSFSLWKFEPFGRCKQSVICKLEINTNLDSFYAICSLYKIYQKLKINSCYVWSLLARFDYAAKIIKDGYMLFLIRKQMENVQDTLLAVNKYSNYMSGSLKHLCK